MEQNLETQLRDAGIIDEELANIEPGEGESHLLSSSHSPIPPPPPALPETRAAAPLAPPTAPPALPVPALVAQSQVP